LALHPLLEGEKTMKGTIVKCLQDLVCTKFGKDKWEKSLEDAGIPKSTSIMPISDYDDALVVKVVGTVCKNLGITLQQAADAFGDYWVNVYSQNMYGRFYAKCKTAKDFLLNMDALHVTMTQTMQNAHPPRFDYEVVNDKTLVMNYKSSRGLIDFLVGLIKGIGTFYKENLKVIKLSPTKVQIVFE
jgi:hypothetical protein